MGIAQRPDVFKVGYLAVQKNQTALVKKNIGDKNKKINLTLK